MNISKKYKILFIYALFITIVPQESSLYSFSVDTVCYVTCLTSNYILYLYYRSAPSTIKTSINTTLQFMSVISAVSLTRLWTISLVLNILPGPTKILFNAYPNLVCSLTSDRYCYFLFYAALNCLFILRCWMKLWPMQFVNLNQDRIGRIVIFISGLYVNIELAASLIRYKTFCGHSYLNMLKIIYEFKIEKDIIQHRHSTPLVLLWSIIGCLAEIIPKVVKKYNKVKIKNRIRVAEPVYVINLPQPVQRINSSNVNASKSDSLHTKHLPEKTCNFKMIGDFIPSIEEPAIHTNSYCNPSSNHQIPSSSSESDANKVTIIKVQPATLIKEQVKDLQA